MFDSLRRCEFFDESPVCFFLDGAKGNGDQDDVTAVRRLVESIDLPNVTHVIRKKNLGLRHSIHDGVGRICEQYGRVIVLEDDFRLSSKALEYFNAALDQYAETDRVWSVAGYMFQVPELRDRTTAFALPFAHPWGWATWQRSWTQFALDAPVSEEMLKSRSFRAAFSMGGLADFGRMLAMSQGGLVNSWFIQWYHLIFRNGGVSIFPPQTYVLNEGVASEGGTHASRLNPTDLFLGDKHLCETLCKLPVDLEVDWSAIDMIVASREASMLRITQSFGAFKRRIKSIARL
jgi:hypothetical protein